MFDSRPKLRYGGKQNFGLHGNANVCVSFIEMQNKITNKGLVKNYSFITCDFRKSNSTLLLVK